MTADLDFSALVDYAPAPTAHVVRLEWAGRSRHEWAKATAADLGGAYVHGLGFRFRNAAAAQAFEAKVSEHDKAVTPAAAPAAPKFFVVPVLKAGEVGEVRGCSSSFLRAHQLRAKLHAWHGTRFEIRQGDMPKGAKWSLSLDAVYPKTIGG